MSSTRPAGLSRDFWVFWSGQTVSNLGNAITLFALPLLVYKLTGSALDLAYAALAGTAPYLLFGLLIGAWADRTDRKRMMILVDLGRAAVIGTVPLLAAFDTLSVWWIYGATFVSSTLTIAFNAGEFAAIPSLVPIDDLVSANGRIQASYSAAFIVGPLIGGALLAFVVVEWVVLVDAVSFLISAIALMLVARPFNGPKHDRPVTSLRADMVEGLRFVWRHPVLRSISIMMALVNMVCAPQGSQLITFADQQLGASGSQIGVLYALGGAGVVVLSLVAGRLRKRWPFSRVALGALVCMGLASIALAFMTSFWFAAVAWAAISGFGVLFNINTGSLRQAITPNNMLGRILTIASVVAISATPIGDLAGGFLIDRSGNVALIFGLVGLLTVAIALAFTLSPIGHAEDYVLATAPAAEPETAAV